MMIKLGDRSTMYLLSSLLFIVSILLSPLSQAVVAENNLTIQLLDGTQDNSPMVNTQITIKELLTDGSKKWHKKVTTDETGQVSLSLDGLGTDKTYILYARSSFNNKYKTLAIDRTGDHTFTVGTPLLEVILRDTETGQTFADIDVTAYQVVTGKKDKYLARTKTAADGTVSFDLPTLSEGAIIRLKAKKVYNNMDSYSSLITQAGEFDFLLATVRVAVLDGRNDQPLANQAVTLYTTSEGKKDKFYGKAITDAQGTLRLSLKDVSENSTASPNYILKTRSPFNNRTKISQIINQIGDHSFYVGDPLLRVTLKNASDNNAVIPNTEVRAYRLVNGKRQQFAKTTTNEQGMVEFDIPDLAEENTIVELATKVFNNKMWARSGRITSLGAVDFPIATTVVTVKDGSALTNSSILANHAVNLREITGEGKSKSIATLTTDAQGLLRLTLPELDNDKQYILRAKNPHPVIKQNKMSQVIDQEGAYTFLVGTPLLNINLLDAMTDVGIVNKQVTVYLDQENVAPKWLGKITTDAQGSGVIDIPLLAADTKNTFFLKAKQPYGTGDVNSRHFGNATFSVNFPVGTTRVILTDKETGSAIANQRVDAYEIIDAQLTRRAKGNTDSTGVVHFDLPLLSSEHPYLFYTRNPFGQQKKYYSEQTNSEGTINFVISVDEDASLDLEAPTVSISSPTPNSEVGETGFILSGIASDNNVIDSIIIELIQGETTTHHTASYDTATTQWNLNINASQLSTAAPLNIRVTTSDDAGNQETISASYTVISDANPPTLTITSPNTNTDVPVTGFILSGTVIDDTGVASLQAHIQTSRSATAIERDIDVSNSGNWSLAVNNGELIQDDTVSIVLTAIDVVGKQTEQTVTFNVVAVSNEARHLINRITFGATPELLDEVRSIGVTAYLNTQLAPDSIDDSALDTLLASNGEPFSIGELQRYQLTHMIHSRRQLKEVMAWFWENHFNTDANKDGNDLAYELLEHNQFRANALGNFRTLLEISAKSPAMLIYLDSILNTRSDANENYAREVMELSTCGVDGCYDEEDVAALAEIFTGWQVRNNQFFFNDSEHTSGSKLFLGVNIPEGGVEEGNTALDMLARHTATAQYICSKLIQVFVSDSVDTGLNARCANTFQATSNASDQMTQVLHLLLTSPEFNNSNNFNSKVKSPVEFVVGTVRAMQAQGSYDNLAGYIRRMGMRLFLNPVPTGWDEEGSTWINSALLQERARFVNQIAFASNSSDTYINPVTFFQNRNLNTTDSIVSYLFDLLGGNIWGDLERQIAVDILNTNGTFDLSSNTAEAQLRELIGTVQSYPEYNYQ